MICAKVKLLLLFFLPCVVADASDLLPLTPHPRLFATEKDFTDLKVKLETSELGRIGRMRLLRESERLSALPPLRHKLEGRRMLAVSREALERIANLAMAFRVTGTERYARAAIDTALTVAGFDDWNPTHFLDAAEMTLAVALARDWLDDRLSDGERRKLTEAILLKGLTSDGHTLRTGFWVDCDINWNPVCNGSLAAGAAAIREDAPDVAEAVLRRTLKSLPVAMKAYAGGGFPEGPACYWEYATDFMVLAIDVLERQFGDVAALLEAPGFREQADYLGIMTGPTGLYFNYSDAGDKLPISRLIAAQWYLARRFDRADTLSIRAVDDFRHFAAGQEDGTGLSHGRMFPFVLLWLQEHSAVTDANRMPLEVALGGANPVAVLRSGLKPDDWYLGLKGGLPEQSHGHSDVGSFVLDAGNVRWSSDLPSEEYDRTERKIGAEGLWSYKPDSPRWKVFRYSEQGHSGLLIDGCPRRTDSMSPVELKDGLATVVMTAAFPSLKKAERHARLTRFGLEMTDELEGCAPGASVTWQMITAAKCEVVGPRVLLKAKDAKGVMRTLTLTAGCEGSWTIRPLDRPSGPFDSGDKGMSAVRLAVCAPSSGALRIDVTFALADADGELIRLRCDRETNCKATGFFRCEQDAQGRWRFVTPGGHGFYAMGCNGPSGMFGELCPALGYAPYTRVLQKKYGQDHARWAETTVGRLSDWGFNVVNSWPRFDESLRGRGVATTRVIQLGHRFARSLPDGSRNLYEGTGYAGIFPDVFNPEFGKFCEDLAEKECGAFRNDPWTFGWFLDNELGWRGACNLVNGCSDDARGGLFMYDLVLLKDGGCPARKAQARFLERRGLKAGEPVPDEVKRDFMRMVANRYFRIASGAVRKAAPNHMVLGCRFMGLESTPDICWEVAGKWCEAISVNWYPPVNFEKGFVAEEWKREHLPIVPMIERLYGLGNRPIVFTEWSYRGEDAGYGNSKGAGQRVPTQNDRAFAADLFVRTMAGRPEVSGYFYFQWNDQPRKGRFDNENNNYGLVDEDDEPWKPLVNAFRNAQGKLYALRRKAKGLPLLVQTKEKNNE